MERDDPSVIRRKHTHLRSRLDGAGARTVPVRSSPLMPEDSVCFRRSLLSDALRTGDRPRSGWSQLQRDGILLGLMRDPKQALQKTLSVIQRGMSDGLHLGAQLYISLKGETIANLAIGESRTGLAMQADTLLLWFSSVKPITAVAIAQLWEQDKLQLDDRVGQFIPEFANPGKETITVRHLLTHTGGFRTADKIPEEIGWEETIARICQTPLEPDWVPGQKAGYHLFSSWFLLGAIVRRIDGRPFARYVREKIFEPLGMFDSWLGMPPEQYRRYGGRIAIMHLRQQGQLRPHPFWNTEQGCALCRPGSNGRGPIRELARFYEALSGAQASRLPAFLQPSTIATFTSRHRIGMFDHTFNHVIDWGLGFIIDSNRYGPETVPYGYGRYCSDRTFGHSGSQSSSAFADPEHGLVVAWACNGLPGEKLHQARAREINSAIYEDLNLLR